MTATGKAPLVGLAIATGLVIVVLGVTNKWPPYLWVIPAVAAVGLAFVMAMSRGPEQLAEPTPVAAPVQAAAPAPDLTPPEAPWRETRADGIALPSRVPDYDFRFSATVWWRPVRNSTGLMHVDPAGLAVETILARARLVTERELPDRLDLVLHRLNGVLGTPGLDAHALVETMGSRVELRLSDEDRSRLDKLSEVRKTEEVWEYERRYEQNKRAYLGQDVLKSPGSALVWWLARHDEQVLQAVDLIGPLAQLSAAAGDRPVDELYQHLTPQAEPEPRDRYEPPAPTEAPSVITRLNDLLDGYALPEDSPERKLTVRRIADITDAAGRPDEAQLIRETLLSDAGSPAGHPQWNGAAVNGSSPGADEDVAAVRDAL